MALKCPLCSSPAPERFLVRTDVPVQQNLVFDTAAAARAIARGLLDLCVCVDCGFVFNAAFDPAKIAYARGYDNDQSFSTCFDRYVDSLVSRLADDVGIDAKVIAEVGCGSGYFLRRVMATARGSTGVGYDPSYSGNPRSDDGTIEFIASTFEGDSRAAGLVICRHVVEHIADPVRFVAGIRSNMGDGAVAVFETPSVEWILRHEVIWDLFYEHCSLFSSASLARLLRTSGFSVRSVDAVFDGQYLWASAAAGDSGVPHPTYDASQIADACRRFGNVEAALIRRWRDAVASASGRGGVAVWGAGAKGATFVSLVDPDARTVSCVVDVNPRKQGRYVAGTGHAIVPPAALRERNVATIFIMNPNYEPEIRAQAADVPGLEFVSP